MTFSKMHACVVIATKGRARETRILLDNLQRQTLPPTYTVIAGTEARDIEGLPEHAWLTAGRGEAILSPRIGSAAQRNFGIEILEQRGWFAKGPFFCAFFDDDYRLADDWLQRAAERFATNDIVGLTGHVLADGVGSGGLTEDQAKTFLNGTAVPQTHWASGTKERAVDSVYGCNMAFLDTVVKQIRFDENLPLYAWQEDRDYTGMAKKLGRVIYFPLCRGVHLGAQKGRTSGVRFGYSQIANPIYLMKKGTMGYKAGIRHMMRNMAANIVRSFTGSHPHVDYPGRLRGNGRAVLDVMRFRSDPRRITDSRF